MKKTDVAMIILIAGISVVIAVVIANSIPALKISDMKTTVPSVQQISPDLAPLDNTLFNGNAINPTQQTIIGN